MLIIIEGRDGVGKTTFAKTLVEKLAEHSIPVSFVREPVDRSCITAEDPIAAFAADRTKQFLEITLPALRRGEIVVSDRSLFSSLAYQNLLADPQIEGRILTENASVVRGLRVLAAQHALRVIVLAPEKTPRPEDENVDANDKNAELQERLVRRFAQVFSRLPSEIERNCFTLRHADAYPAALDSLVAALASLSKLAQAPGQG